MFAFPWKFHECRNCCPSTEIRYRLCIVFFFAANFRRPRTHCQIKGGCIICRATNVKRCWNSDFRMHSLLVRRTETDIRIFHKLLRKITIHRTTWLHRSCRWSAMKKSTSEIIRSKSTIGNSKGRPSRSKPSELSGFKQICRNWDVGDIITNTYFLPPRFSHDWNPLWTSSARNSLCGNAYLILHSFLGTMASEISES